MSRTVVINSAVDEYTRLCAGAPAIVFTVDIRHSKLVAQAFADRGYRAAHVDGETPRDERRHLIAALATGELQVLSNCGLISEGLDVPGVVAAILLRPTKSLALFLQQVGRALRPAPGKTKALILDHAGNTLRHGLPDEPREWSLDGRAKKHGHAPLCRCEECGALNPISAEHCHECGTYFPDQRSPTKRARIEVSSRLVEVDRLQAMSYRAAIRWAGGDRARLEMVAMARGYKPGWVWHRMQELLQGGEL